MKPKKAASLNIVVALIFAAAIIISSMVIDDPEQADKVTYFIIALWIIPFAWINHQIAKNK